jgi:hypothetical protein
MLSNLTPQQTALIYLRLDKNRNGKLEGDEIPERLRPFVGAVDKNGDQAIEPVEIEEFRQEMRKLRGETSDEPEPETSKPDAPAPKPPSPEPMSDINGRPVDPLHPADGIKANVLIFVTHDCPVSNQYSREINRIARDYRGQSVSAYLVHVEPDLTPEDAKAHASEYGLDDLTILIDRKHALVQKTGAKITPEAAVIAPDGTIAYCGRIDDRFTKLGRQRPEPAARDLRDALDAVLKGEPIAHPRVAAIGCPIPDLDQ